MAFPSGRACANSASCTGISVLVSAADRRPLQAIVADPKSQQKQVWRARIVLRTDEGIGTSGIMTATDKSKTCGRRWQERFMEAGVNGLPSDRTRLPGRAPIAQDRVAEVVHLTLAPPPTEATHWTARAMAKAVGMAVSNGPGHLEGARFGAAPLAQLQAVQRPRLRREASRHRRPLRVSCRPCGGAVDR